MKYFFSLALLLSLVSIPVFAHEGHDMDKMKMAEPSKEDRMKMADMHTKMAACLNSTKSSADCHKEMMANCPMMKEGKSCPMMGMMDKMPDHKMHAHKKDADDKDEKEEK